MTSPLTTPDAMLRLDGTCRGTVLVFFKLRLTRIGAPMGAAASNGSGPGADASGPGAAPAASGGAEATAGAAADGAGGPATIEELQLPVRAYNSLRRVGIHTVDDLSARTEAELLAIENLGPQSVREIKERLAGVGRHLAEQPADAPAAAEAGGAPTAAADGAAADGARAGVRPPEEPGPAAPAAAPLGARPPDEDAIDLLSVAGFPVLKRALPVLAAVAVLLLVIFGLRRGRRSG